MARLIAFAGKAGIGKDTAADYLVEKHRYNKKSFAEPMKKAVQSMFGLKHEQVFGTKEQKEEAIPALSQKRPISGRELLQTLGTEWGRNIIDPDIWIYKVAEDWKTMKNIPGYVGMVISDLRFDNEAEWVKSQGGIVINIESPFNPPTDKFHPSENGIDINLVDHVIMNYKKRKEDLYTAIEVILDIEKDKVPLEESTEQNIGDLIVKWADKVFPDRTINNALNKMVFEEIPEYMLERDPLELADIGILLYDIANLAGIDLDAAMREKMEINKNREWKIDETTGLMSHVDLKCPTCGGEDRRSCSCVYKY